MKLFKGLAIVLCVALTSMFFFPFDFRALPPGMNTKKIMAAAALVILLWKLVQKRELKMDKSFLYLSILAGLVSLCGIISVTYNNTEDYAYATYITSAWVWWGGAYTVCTFIKWVHGKVTPSLVINYLIAVCVCQCALALAMDMNKPLKLAVNSVALQGDLVFKGGVHRLYGIGACLDVAGSRFAAVLMMLVFMLTHFSQEKRWYAYAIYIASFIFITIAGNMIARTTLVGTLLGMGYLAVIAFRPSEVVKGNAIRLWKWLIGVSILAIPLAIYTYNTNPQIQKNMRFGFEGFFNYFEEGDFNYGSTETLKNMYVLPDNPKTWIIGDAYFDNPAWTDPYYTGDITEGFYKNTDIGYLRFIFYFGVVGLLMFSFFFIEVGRTCMRRFPEWKLMFLMLLALHFIVWAKVSSDLFMAFAPFLCLDSDNGTAELYETLRYDNDDENETCLSDSRDV